MVTLCTLASFDHSNCIIWIPCRWLSEEEIRENRDVAYKSKKDQSASAAVSSSNKDHK